MDFLTALHISGTGLSAERTRVNLASSNLANAETTRTAAGGAYQRLDPVFEATPIQQSFFRAGHAHAGVYLILGLVAQVLVDATTLTGPAEWVARTFIPIAALLLPGGFFLSVSRPGATEPNRLVALVPAGHRHQRDQGFDDQRHQTVAVEGLTGHAVDRDLLGERHPPPHRHPQPGRRPVGADAGQHPLGERLPGGVAHRPGLGVAAGGAPDEGGVRVAVLGHVVDEGLHAGP